MINLNESDLDGYLTTWVQRKYPHLISPWFQGTVLGVNGTSPPYTVTLQRLGEPGPDGGEYVVAPTGYVPVVGDNVECCWRDAHSAYVMWPLNDSGANAQQNAFACTLYRVSTFTSGTGFMAYGMEGILDDPQGMAEAYAPGFYQIQIPQDGIYMISGLVHSTSTSLSIQQTIQHTQRGTTTWMYGSTTGATSVNMQGSVTSQLRRCYAGDLITAGLWANGAAAIVPSAERHRMSVVRVSS